ETLADRDELEIIRTYKTIVRGIIQYFCLANNLWVRLKMKRKKIEEVTCNFYNWREEKEK
ncbi:MAG: hypothetical protein Q8754_02785, partial [Sweet potato little leaf phytoplasma]|nr:hypothetical protein [Sweet potato little leaf phytoplasma]